ncbi:MAG: hypothetical protein ACLFVC_09415 [Opitutales bacterium]
MKTCSPRGLLLGLLLLLMAIASTILVFHLRDSVEHDPHPAPAAPSP